MKGRSAAAINTPQIEDRDGVAGSAAACYRLEPVLIGFRFAALQTRSTQARRFDGKRTSTWRSRLPAGHALLSSIVA
jgi:hypothetical protein